MNITVYSRKAITELIHTEQLKDSAVISFYSPVQALQNKDPRIDYQHAAKYVFYVAIPDIDIEVLEKYAYTYQSYLKEADELAKFIYKVKREGCRIVCQCDFGQSRSAACAAAILEHFEGRGIDVFADYRYYPNQLVYHKIFDALEKIK